MTSSPSINTSNYEKFQTGNPLVRRMFNNFYSQLEQLIVKVNAKSILDAGCGEGEALARLQTILPDKITGFDIRPECVEFSSKRHPDFHFEKQNIYELPYESNSFDLVICSEVLEHLDRPHDALKELIRVSRKGLIATVPHEPWFWLGSLARGKYLRTFGNHPEHIQHWTPKSFHRFLKQETKPVQIKTSFPWILAWCRKDSH